MTGLENVGVRSKRKERKHYDEHQDTRCIWEAFGTPSRSPSPTASRPSSPMAGAAGRVLNAGFYELHEGGRRAHGSYAHKDRQVPALGTQVWQCIAQARSVSPQEARGAGGCDLSAEYGFKRLGKPKVPASAGQQSSILLQWSELRSDPAEPAVVPSGKSHVGHFGQDSQQTLDCLQMKRCGGYTKSPRSATSPVPDGSRVNVEDMRPPVLCQEEVRAGMTRRAGRGLRATLPGQTLRSYQTSPRDGPLYDDLRVEKHLPSRGGKKDWNRNSSRMAEMVSPRQENRNLGQQAVVSSHGLSEMWAPWLLTYEKELQEQTVRLRNLAGGAPVPLPFGLGAAGSGPRILDRGRGRSRSPERSKLRGMAGKPSQEGPLCGRPFWLGDTDSATPESTSHSYYGRSQSLRRQRPTQATQTQAAELDPGQPTLPSKNTGAEAPLRSPVQAPKEEAEAQSSPSRFKHDNPTSLREQLAAESFLAPNILAAGKPIVFGFMDENRRPPHSSFTVR